MKFMFKFLIAFLLSLAILPAHSGGSLTLLKSGGAGGGAAPATVTYITAGGGCASQVGTCTFAGVSIGTASATRYVVFMLSNISVTTGTISNVLIAGSPATFIAGSVIGTDRRAILYGASVPTGTTATISSDWQNSTGGGGVSYAVWSLDNLLSTTPVNTQTGNAINVVNLSPLTTSADGVAIAVDAANLNTAQTSADITGISPQNFQQSPVIAQARTAGNSQTTNGASLNITCTYVTSSLAGACTAASFR